MAIRIFLTNIRLYQWKQVTGVFEGYTKPLGTRAQDEGAVMDPQRWAKIESLYHAVLNKEPSERSGYLARACAGDSGLRHEVETLLGCADVELKSPTTDAFLSD